MTSSPGFKASAAVLSAVLAMGAAHAAPVTYDVDPTHTYPSFEADHMGGLSVWRGKFDRSKGRITMDRAAATGTVEIEVDMNSADFGLAALDKEAKGKELFETAKYPRAAFKGTLADFVDGAPTHAPGTLTLHGVTKPVTLDIRKFKCMPHPMLKREVCGADVYATIQRDEFGMPAGKDYGFDMGQLAGIPGQRYVREHDDGPHQRRDHRVEPGRRQAHLKHDDAEHGDADYKRPVDPAGTEP